jgi:hypothetical protein
LQVAASHIASPEVLSPATPVLTKTSLLRRNECKRAATSGLGQLAQNTPQRQPAAQFRIHIAVRFCEGLFGNEHSAGASRLLATLENALAGLRNATK